MLEAYAMCLIAGLFFAWMTRNGRMAFAVGVLFVNWLVCVLWAIRFPTLAMDPIALTMFDLAAAVMLLVPALRRRAPDWYLILVALYLVQLLAHLASILVPHSEQPHWLSLSATAWAQLAVAWGGGGYELGRHIFGELGDLGADRSSHAGDVRTSGGGEA